MKAQHALAASVRVQAEENFGVFHLCVRARARVGGCGCGYVCSRFLSRSLDLPDKTGHRCVTTFIRFSGVGCCFSNSTGSYLFSQSLSYMRPCRRVDMDVYCTQLNQRVTFRVC